MPGTFSRQGVVPEGCLDQVNNMLTVDSIRVPILRCRHQQPLEVLCLHLQWYDLPMALEVTNIPLYLLSLGDRVVYR